MKKVMTFCLIVLLSTSVYGQTDNWGESFFHGSGWLEKQFFGANEDNLTVVELMAYMHGSLAGDRNFEFLDEENSYLNNWITEMEGKIFSNGIRLIAGGYDTEFPYHQKNLFARTYWFGGKTGGLGIVAGIDMWSYYDNIHTMSSISHPKAEEGYGFKAITTGVYLEKNISNKLGNVYFFSEGSFGKRFLQGRIQIEQNFREPFALGAEVGFVQRTFPVQSLDGKRPYDHMGVNSDSYLKAYLSLAGWFEIYTRYDYKFSTINESRNLGFTIGFAFDIVDTFIALGCAVERL